MERGDVVSRVLSARADVTDEATGLWRQSYFLVILRREVTRVRRTGETLTVGILAPDRRPDATKRSAARALPEAALGAIIRKHVREMDAATYSGDGVFPLVFPRASAASARAAGERLRAAVEEELAEGTTVSIGLASFPDDGLDEEAIVGRAADAYLHAVEAGGNRVFCFEPPQRQPSVAEARVLLVDDDPRNLKLLAAQLEPLGFQWIKAASGEQALDIIHGVEVDLVLLDVMLPGIDGFEVCRRIKAGETTRHVPVILLTALEDTPSRLKGIEAGADDFITKPANREELAARTRSLIRVRRMNRDLVSLENALISLANAVEAKDNYTLGHTQRVSTLAVALGAAMGLDPTDQQALRLGGILHDVGKIGVPEKILNKPGPLTVEEWELMKSHAELGYKICLPLLESIGPALDIIRHHHEKLDGSSYPDGLKGNDISLMARIMSVVDSYDALTTDRPYRPAMSKDDALSILREEVDRGRLDGRVLGVLESLVRGRPVSAYPSSFEPGGSTTPSSLRREPSR